MSTKPAKGTNCDPIRLGIIGIGRAGWGMHVKELESRADTFTIVAACDVEQERLDCMSKAYACATYLDVDAFLADTSMEMVSIATRSPDHVAHTVKVLEAGKLVFLEKPIALTLADAERLEAVSKRYPDRLFFRHNRRFEAGFQHVREIMASGILGDIYEVKLHRHNYQRRDDWQSLIGCGAGQLNNWGPHIIDHALRFLESPVAEQWSDLRKVTAVGDAEDHVSITLKGENERIVSLQISGGVALPQPTYVVFGDRGTLTCDDQDIKLKFLRPDFTPSPREACVETPAISGGFTSSDKLLWVRKTIMVEPAAACNTDSIWDHLYAAVRGGVPFPITMEEAMDVVRVSVKARMGTRFEQS